MRAAELLVVVVFQETDEMKKIETVIKPFELEDVRNALREVGLEDIVATETKHFRRGAGHIEFYRGADCEIGYDIEVKIEIVLAENIVERAVHAIRGAAHVKQICVQNISVLTETGPAHDLSRGLDAASLNYRLAS